MNALDHDPACLYAIALLPQDGIDDLLLDVFAPLAREWRARPELDSLFFVRYSEPEWQLRFRVLGRPDWVGGPARERIEAGLEAARRSGAIHGLRFARYEREWERYGGTLGMRLAERLFFHDSMAAIELCEADRRGDLATSRRQVALLLVDRLIDAAGLDASERQAFYRHGYSWALETGKWSAQDRELLEQRFRTLLPDLERLLSPDLDESRRWGGEAPARIVDRFLAAARSVLQDVRGGIARGEIAQDYVYLVWSYAHMLTNRLGFDATVEAVLRYFMHRYGQERRIASA